MDEYRRIREAVDVDDEIVEAALSIVDGFYATRPAIDWEDVLDRMEMRRDARGRQYDLGGDADSPAIRKIKREVRRIRREGGEE